MNVQVSRVPFPIDLKRDFDTLPVCERCVMFERAIREHKRMVDASGAYKAEYKAHKKLWAVVGL